MTNIDIEFKTLLDQIEPEFTTAIESIASDAKRIDLFLISNNALHKVLLKKGINKISPVAKKMIISYGISYEQNVLGLLQED